MFFSRTLPPVFVVSIICLVLSQNTLAKGRYNLAHHLLNQALYRRDIPQTVREKLFQGAVAIIPDDSAIVDGAALVAAREQVIFLADNLRKHGVWARDVWELSLALEASGGWHSFEMPPEAIIEENNFRMPLDEAQWGLQTNLRFNDGTWVSSNEGAMEFAYEDDIVAIQADNTQGVYELFVATWYGPVGTSSSCDSLNFEFRELLDSSVELTVYVDSQDVFVPSIRPIRGEGGWKVAEISGFSGSTLSVDFYVTDSNLNDNPKFGVLVRRSWLAFCD